MNIHYKILSEKYYQVIKEQQDYNSIIREITPYLGMFRKGIDPRDPRVLNIISKVGMIKNVASVIAKYNNVNDDPLYLMLLKAGYNDPDVAQFINSDNNLKNNAKQIFDGLNQAYQIMAQMNNILANALKTVPQTAINEQDQSTVANITDPATRNKIQGIFTIMGQYYSPLKNPIYVELVKAGYNDPDVNAYLNNYAPYPLDVLNSKLQMTVASCHDIIEQTYNYLKPILAASKPSQQTQTQPQAQPQQASGWWSKSN